MTNHTVQETLENRVKMLTEMLFQQVSDRRLCFVSNDRIEGLLQTARDNLKEMESKNE